jgi:hypothetical protein
MRQKLAGNTPITTKKAGGLKKRGGDAIPGIPPSVHDKPRSRNTPQQGKYPLICS